MCINGTLEGTTSNSERYSPHIYEVKNVYSSNKLFKELLKNQLVFNRYIHP